MASSLDDIKKLKKKLSKATEPEPILETLEVLSKCEISIEILKETKIGKAVGKLRKRDHKQIAQAASGLVGKWKQLVGDGSTSTPPPSSSPSSTPPTSTPSKENNNGAEQKAVKEEASSQDDNNKKRKIEKESSSTNSSPAKTQKKSKRGSDEDNNNDNGNDSSSSSGGSAKKSSVVGGSAADREVRNKCIQMLTEALGMKLEGDLEPADVAVGIEEELHSMFKGVSREYKTKFRSLHFNLKNDKNPLLRQQVLNGAISAKRLCTMSANDMASEELKKERQRMAEYQLEASKLRQFNQTSTDMFKCGKCGKRETTYYQMQTRSADEPMTTFHTCTNCGNRWKS